MLSAVMQALGMSRNTEVPLGAERTIDLSGNIFRFALPENFSSDMPASDLVEKVDLTQLSDSDAGLLLERWWDLKEPRLFGQELGSLMMTINVRSAPENSYGLLHKRQYEFTSRLDLIFGVHERLVKEYPKLDSSTFLAPALIQLQGSDVTSSYLGFVFNRQAWIRYGLYREDDANLKIGYVLPVTDKAYLDVVFHYAPNANIDVHSYQEQANQLADRILNTFSVTYKNGNPVVKQVQEEWHEETVNDLFQKHSEKLVPALFGPDAIENAKKPVEIPPGMFDDE